MISLEQKPPGRKYYFVSVCHEACHKRPIKKQQQQKEQIKKIKKFYNAMVE